jgi:uncharacterized iron-regulated membrane protein
MNLTNPYRMLWRWHFYAGLFVIPFILVLATSGSIFLFKPQIDRWEERAFQGLPSDGAATPTRQVEAALAAFPDSLFHSYRLPQRGGDAAMVHLALGNHGAMRDVFVSPQGTVLGSLDPDARIIALVRRIHGQLLLGPRGSWLVELAASWAIVMVVTGLYLWWPRGRGLAGVVWPRRRSLLRDLHAVTGFWVAGLALVLLLTGLPWADVWGNAFRAVRTQMGWVQGTPGWSLGGRSVPVADGTHAAHDHGAMHVHAATDTDIAPLDAIVAKAAGEQLAFPVLVIPPGAPRDFTGAVSTGWTLKSDAQNRPLATTITFDGSSGAELAREGFSDQHPIDQVVGYGIAWHEGQLFGALNQLIGVVTALALVTMSVTGFLMWRRRRPAGLLGAPPLPPQRRKPAFVAIAMLLLALFLPLLAASLLLLWLFDRLLPHVSPATATWLGIIPGDKKEVLP